MFSKMGVNKAAHVFSHSVAAGVYAELGRMPGEAVNTAQSWSWWTVCLMPSTAASFVAQKS